MMSVTFRIINGIYALLICHHAISNKHRQFVLGVSKVFVAIGVSILLAAMETYYIGTEEHGIF